MNNLNLETRGIRGLSQFEVILVMAVIGVISAIAVPLFSNLTDSSKLGVLKANLHHMNSIIREAHRAGSVTTNINLEGEDLTVTEVCTSLTSGAGVFVDTDGDGDLDPHEVGFEMDIPPNASPYDYLIGQHLTGSFTVELHGDDPVQLAIYEEEALYEIP